MAEEDLEQRLQGLERSIKVFLILVLVSMSCSLAALVVVVVALIIG